MSDRYILNANGEPVEEPDLIKWGRWLQKADRKIAEHDIGDCHVSTVFMGLNHQYGPGPPLVFETMVFGPDDHPLNQEMARYATRGQALSGHHMMCDRVRIEALTKRGR